MVSNCCGNCVWYALQDIIDGKSGVRKKKGQAACTAPVPASIGFAGQRHTRRLMAFTDGDTCTAHERRQESLEQFREKVKTQLDTEAH